MRIKKVYAKKDEIPEFARSLFEEKDGKFIRREDVELEGDEDDEDDDGGKNKLKEFRNTNKTLLKENGDIKSQLAELQKKFGGIDEETIKSLQAQAAKARDDEEREMLKTGRHEEVYTRRNAAVVKEKNDMIAQLQKQHKEANDKYQTLASTFATDRAQRKINTLLQKQGMRLKQGAEEDLRMILSRDWTTDERGNLTPLNESLQDDDGNKITEPEKYIEHELVKRRPYYFEPAKGGGASGNSDPSQNGTGFVNDDMVSMGNNLERIAKGEVQVRRK